MTDTIELARIEAWAFRCPTTRPVATSFGIMHDRPAVFVRIEDVDGAVGWGRNLRQLAGSRGRTPGAIARA